MIANRSQNPEAQVATSTQVATTLNFTAFDSSSALWKGFWSRFCTFGSECQETETFSDKPDIFDVQSISNLVAKETPRRDINDLAMDQISIYIKTQFDPKRLFIVREIFRF